MSMFKVKKEVVEQLELLISNYPKYENKSLLLEEHYLIINSNGDEQWDIDKYNLLNNLSFSEMYDLSHDNYEIELDAEYEIRDTYNDNKLIVNNSDYLGHRYIESRWFIRGVEFVLCKLNKEYIIKQFLDKKVGE